MALERQAAPPAAPAAHLASLQPYVGRYPGDGYNYLREGPLAQRLEQLLGVQYATLLDNLQVSSPLKAEGGQWFITGNRQHQGGMEQAALVVDPRRDALRVWLRTDGEDMEFDSPRGARLPWPEEVRLMQRNPHRLGSR